MNAPRALVQTLAKWLISLAIGVLFIWLSTREWPIDRLFAGGLRIEHGSLATDAWSVHLGWLLAYFLTLVSLHVFRVWRWQPLLKPLKNCGFWQLNRVCSVGFMAMFVLPMRVGEFVRPVLLASETGLSKSALLATIVVERVMDGVMVAGFLAIALLFLPAENLAAYTEIRIGTYLALAVFGGLVIALFLMFAFRAPLSVSIHKLLSRTHQRRATALVVGLLDRFLAGLSILPDWRNFLLFVFLSLFYWLSNGFGLFILAHGFGLDIPVIGAFAMMAAVVVGMMIPNAPANVGSFWYFLLKPVELYGVTAGNPAALAYALVVWTMQLVQLLLFAAYFLMRGQVSFRSAFVISGSALQEEATS